MIFSLPKSKENFAQEIRLKWGEELPEANSYLIYLTPPYPSAQELNDFACALPITYSFPYLPVELASQLKTPFVIDQEVRSTFELKALKELGVASFYPASPLFFQQDSIAYFNLPMRLRPNDPYTWIRPEDLSLYPSNSIIELPSAVYYRIYAQKGFYHGDISHIIPSLPSNASNALIANDLGKRRLNCRQKCLEGKCNYCDICFSLAQKKEVKDIVFPDSNSN